MPSTRCSTYARSTAGPAHTVVPSGLRIPPPLDYPGRFSPLRLEILAAHAHGFGRRWRRAVTSCRVVHDQEGEVGMLCLEPLGASLQIAEHQAGGVAVVEAGASDAPDGGVESRQCWLES